MNHLSFHVLGIGASGPDQRQSGRNRPEPHGLPPIRTLIVVIDYILVILALSEKQSQGAAVIAKRILGVGCSAAISEQRGVADWYNVGVRQIGVE